MSTTKERATELAAKVNVRIAKSPDPAFGDYGPAAKYYGIDYPPLTLDKIYNYAQGLGREGDLRTNVVCLANALTNLVTYLKEVEDGHRQDSSRQD